MKLIGRSLTPHIRGSWFHEKRWSPTAYVSGLCKVTKKKKKSKTLYILLEGHKNLHISYKTGLFVKNNVLKYIHRLLFKI